VNGIRQSTKTVVLSTNVDAGQFSATAVAGPATVADDAGNDVLVQTASFKVDREIPVIVDPSEPLALGGTVTPVCTDAGSGIANCVAGPADTSEPGSVDVSVSATDVAGNTVTRTVTYEVAYGICLNYDPTKTSNPGSSVPIKVFLCDAAGNNLSSNQIVLTAVGIDDGAAAPNSTGKSNDDPYEFRYSSKDGQYIYTFDSTGLTAQPDPHLFKFVIGSSSVVYSVPFRISAG